VACEHTFVYGRIMTKSDYAQRIVLGLLLERHPTMLTAEEVRRTLSDVPELDHAISQLVADRVANRVGDLIGASRAAVRTDQLAI
jgi:hypothetical protein